MFLNFAANNGFPENVFPECSFLHALKNNSKRLSDISLLLKYFSKSSKVAEHTPIHKYPDSNVLKCFKISTNSSTSLYPFAFNKLKISLYEII